MTKSTIKTTRTRIVFLTSLLFVWVSVATAGDHDGVHIGDKKKVINHPSDGHDHKKKSKKSQHKCHKHKAGSHEDEEHHNEGHHDDDDSHDHSGNKHKSKSKKKKGKKKHKQEHQDDDHDHKHGEEDDHSNHSDDGNEHEGHTGHDGHGEHGDEGFGEGKAITEVRNEGESFKLADEAQSLLGLGYNTIKKSVSNNVYIVPTKSIIYFNDEKGIFVKNNGWFKLVDVKLVKKDSKWSQVRSRDLSLGQKIVVSGTGLLRVAHLQASGQGGQGHAH